MWYRQKCRREFISADNPCSLGSVCFAFLLAFINANMKRIRSYRNCKENRITCSLFLIFYFFFSRGVNVRERQHTVTDAQREIIVFVYARCDEYNSMQQMYRRLVSLNLWMKKKKKRRTAKSKRKLFRFNLWPFLCLRVVNKINKHKTSNGPFAIAYGERNKK